MTTLAPERDSIASLPRTVEINRFIAVEAYQKTKLHMAGRRFIKLDKDTLILGHGSASESRIKLLPDGTVQASSNTISLPINSRQNGRFTSVWLNLLEDIEGHLEKQVTSFLGLDDTDAPIKRRHHADQCPCGSCPVQAGPSSQQLTELQTSPEIQKEIRRAARALAATPSATGS